MDPSASPTNSRLHERLYTLIRELTGMSEDEDLSTTASLEHLFESFPETSQEDLARVIHRQLNVMSAQLDLISRLPGVPSPSICPAGIQGTSVFHPSIDLPDPSEASFDQDALTEEQKTYLFEFIARYRTKTAASENTGCQYRSFAPSPGRSTSSHKALTEIRYPIVITESRGAHLRDIDTNEYIDLSMGSGMNLFGHAPDFVTEAVERQLRANPSCNAFSPMTGEVSKLLCDLTNQQMALLYPSSAEAIEASLRLSRLHTGRPNFVFLGGVFPQPSVPPALAQHAMVLDYGAPASLQIIAEQAPDIAGVLVESVLHAQIAAEPRQFLRTLRQITKDYGILFVMNEERNGFRAALGGDQEILGIRADLTTYGKGLSSGMPLGALSGKAAFMKSLDRDFRRGPGATSDQSFFSRPITLNPLALAAAHAVLERLREVGPSLQDALSTRTRALVEDLNAFFAENHVPLIVLRSASSFQFMPVDTFEHMDLLHFHLLEQGLFIEHATAPCFLSAAHTEADISAIKSRVEAAVLALQQVGFLSRGVASPPLVEQLYQNGSTVHDSGAPAPALQVSQHTNGHAHSKESGPSADQPEPDDKEVLTSSRDIQESAPEPASNPGPAALEDSPRLGDADFEKLSWDWPLTEAQAHIWLTSKRGADASSAHNECMTVRFRGSLDHKAFKKAFRDTLLRHEALYLRINARRSRQAIAPVQPVPLRLIDLSMLDTAEQTARVNTLEHQYASTAFDLERGPMLRAALVRLAPDEHLFLFCTHQIVCDARSCTILLDEIGQLYGAYMSDTVIVHEEAPAFTRYLSHSNERAFKKALRRSYTYWLSQYASPPPVLNWPVDHRETASMNGRVHRHRLSSSAFESIRSFCTKYHASQPSVLLASLTALLFRLTGLDDFAIAVPSTGPLQFGENKLIGPCTHILPVRISMIGGRSFFEHLRTTAAQLNHAYDHHECTLGGILKHLKRSEAQYDETFVKVGFNAVRTLVPQGFDGLSSEVCRPVRPFTGLDLSASFVEDADGLFVDLSYREDLFSDELIERWTVLFEALTLAATETPETELEELTNSIQGSEHIFRSAYTRTRTTYPHDKTITALFQQQVQASLDAPAVRFENTTLTYAELDAYSNQFARYLSDHGAGKGTLVGIHMERSAGMVVALLGILKLGSAFVLIDSGLPPRRIAHLLEDTEATLLLTEKGLIDKLDPETVPDATSVVSLDDEWERIEQRASDPLDAEVHSGELACVHYVSSATGYAQGVELRHRSLVNALWSLKEKPGFSSSDTLLSIAPANASYCLIDLFLPILSGGTLMIAPSEVISDGFRIASLLENSEVTVIQAPPSTWTLLLDSGWQGKERLRIFCGGEPLSGVLARKLYARCEALWNLYGTAEACVWSSAYQVNADEPIILIGKPLANTEYYILDDHHELVLPGSIGRLYIGGHGITEGYRNCPQLTEDKFIKHPFSSREDERLFDTGDLARIHSSGYLEFIGRSDFQIKHRGIRVHPAEIERILNSEPTISDAAVHLTQHGFSPRKMVAYYTANEGTTIDPRALRKTFEAQLPEEMIPSFFLELDAIHRTPEGEIDRDLLPDPLLHRSYPERSYQGPRTRLESVIAQTWEEMLQVERIGVHEDYFDLGGNAFLMRRIIARLKERTNQCIPVQMFIDNPTVADLALVVTGLQARQETDADIMRMIEELDDLTEEEIADLLREKKR